MSSNGSIARMTYGREESSEDMSPGARVLEAVVLADPAAPAAHDVEVQPLGIAHRDAPRGAQHRVRVGGDEERPDRAELEASHAPGVGPAGQRVDPDRMVGPRRDIGPRFDPMVRRDRRRIDQQTHLPPPERPVTAAPRRRNIPEHRRPAKWTLAPAAVGAFSGPGWPRRTRAPVLSAAKLITAGPARQGACADRTPTVKNGARPGKAPASAHAGAHPRELVLQRGQERHLGMVAAHDVHRALVVLELLGVGHAAGRVELAGARELVGGEDRRRGVPVGRSAPAQLALALVVGVDARVLRELGDEARDVGPEALGELVRAPRGCPRRRRAAARRRRRARGSPSRPAAPRRRWGDRCVVTPRACASRANR